MQHRADMVQRGDAIAADGPVVCEGREADDPGSGTEFVEERIDDEDKEVATEGASDGKTGLVLNGLGNDTLKDEVDHAR